MKLGKRLQALDAMVVAGYDQIWDGCCDHGLLGAALLSRRAAPLIHFVDLVPALMQQLAHQLQRHFPLSAAAADEGVQPRWQVHCCDLTSLRLDAAGGRQLVIIAGVGGDLMARMVEGLCLTNPNLSFDLLLCPANHAYNLRAQLIALGLGLKHEQLVADNRRYYELLLLTTEPGAGRAVSPAGDQLWQTSNPEQAVNAARYREQSLRHYQRMQLSQGERVQPQIEAYQRVQLPSEM
ncbi:MAG: tRNA (adenine(22)-N(1))-methyltransferase TrmK [Gammaproteobacteria bacterium]|nr:tRNA (adenine(22)-N(1))-methyltransferase TrmK [Gammaproteobacteria bacterium]